MRRLANVYLVLYLLDAGLSLFDELLRLSGSGPTALSGLRMLNAMAVLSMSFVVYAILGFDRRWPKRVFLPLTLYVFWASVGLWPLLGILPRASFGITAAMGQVMLAGVAVLTLRSFYGGVQLSEAQFAGESFGWRNTIIFSVVNLLLLPLMVAFSLLASVGVYLDTMTAGFIRVSPIGIYIAEQDYTRGAQSVRLNAMVHIARSEYYQELADSLPAEKTVILTEGVTDREQLLRNGYDYQAFAELVGLVSQKEMELDGNLVAVDQLGKVVSEKGKADIVHADVDLSSFRPETVEFLNVLGRTLFGDKPLAEGLVDYNAWAEEHVTPESVKGVMADILDHRNEVVIEHLRNSLKYYDTVVIPWGAMHMPGIEKAVLAQGFVPGARHERLGLDFRTVRYARLWQQWQQAVVRQQQLLREEKGL